MALLTLSLAALAAAKHLPQRTEDTATGWAEPRDFYNTTGMEGHTKRKLPWELAATLPDVITFDEHPHTPRVKHATGETTATFYSTEWSLLPGQVVFTDPDRTVIKVPNGDVAITSIKADIVDVDHKAVPLDEVYLHHWILLDKQKPNNGVCGGYLKYVFGVGAETRNTPYDFPKYNGNTYGWITNNKHDRWTANIHALRTVNLDDEQGGLKACIECHGPNKYCKVNGGFMCCPDKARCATVHTGTPSDAAKSYFFRYQVTYVEAEAENVRQAANFILDVSHPHCNIEYNIPANDKGIDEATVHATLPFDVRIFQMWGHIHLAGYNISLFNGKTADGTAICTSDPVYGTEEHKVGNEKGYVVAMTKCKFLEKPYIIKKGEDLTLQALYNVGEFDDRTWNTGYHDGVMGLWFMTGERCKTKGCENEDDSGPMDDRVIDQDDFIKIKTA